MSTTNKTRARWVQEGRCRDCGKSPLATKLRCRRCADRHNKGNRAYEAEARGIGKCIWCSNPAAQGSLLCETCRAKTRKGASIEGVIYFIGEEGDDQFVKVGVSQQLTVNLRLGQLQTGNPRKLVLLGTVNAGDLYGLEGFLHQHLGDLWVRGEWFRRNEELNALITGLVR